MSTAIALALAGATSVTVGWVAYFIKVYDNATPQRPVGSMILEVGGALSAVAAIVLSFADGGSPGAGVIVPAALALPMGLLFPALMSQRKTPVGDLRVEVGDSMLPFRAQTSEGVPFDSDELLGRRVLFKFFRGGW